MKLHEVDGTDNLIMAAREDILFVYSGGKVYQYRIPGLEQEEEEDENDVDIEDSDDDIESLLEVFT